MGNPITDLWSIAVNGWEGLIRGYNKSWQDMYDAYNLSNFENSVRDAISELAQAVEYGTAIIATSDIDTISIVRDGLQGTIDNFRRLAWPILPRYYELARQWADRVALVRALQAEAYTRTLVSREHKAMELRVLQEELARLVEVADVWAKLHTEIAIERNDRILEVAAVRAQLLALIAKTRADLLAYINQQVARLTGLINQLSAYAHSLPGLIDQEAVNGYNPTLRARAGTLQRLIDTLAAHDPFIAGVIGDMVTFLIDLAEVDNPVLRLAAQFVLRQVINHLALDTALRDLASELLGGILGAGPPKTLTGVTEAIGNRLNAVEKSVSDMSPLAGEADDLHEMGTLAFDAALLGYLVTGVTDPRAWADDTNAVLHVTIDPILAPLLDLLGAP